MRSRWERETHDVANEAANRLIPGKRIWTQAKRSFDVKRVVTPTSQEKKRSGCIRSAHDKIDVGFEPHPFEKALVEQTKDDIQNRLHGHEFGRFKIVLKKPPQCQQIALQFLGDPESCEKAKRLLGIYCAPLVLIISNPAKASVMFQKMWL